MCVSVKVTPTVPDSGPGPTTLKAGTIDEGYFGITTLAQLFTPDEVAAAGPMTTGTPNTAANTDQNGWLKFIKAGKIFYIAKRPFRITNIAWADIYAAGMVYGTNDNGKYPVGTPVNQLRTLTKVAGDGKTYTFKVRLPQVANVDPAPDTSIAIGTNTEWTMFERCLPTVGNPVVWDNIGTANIDSLLSMGMESRTTYTEYFVAAGGNSNYGYRSHGQKANDGINWRPVLEIISVT
jgi:hypothetical protein